MSREGIAPKREVTHMPRGRIRALFVRVARHRYPHSSAAGELLRRDDVQKVRVRSRHFDGRLLGQAGWETTDVDAAGDFDWICTTVLAAALIALKRPNEDRRLRSFSSRSSSPSWIAGTAVPAVTSALALRTGCRCA